MLSIISSLSLLLLLSACDPFTDDSGNQFSVQKQTLLFENKKLTRWVDKQIPYCERCSFNFYSKKMSSRSMLFRQINNPSGDLVLLVASNIRYGFALQTGAEAYTIVIKTEGERTILSYAQQASALTLVAQQKQIIMLGEKRYFVVLQGSDSEQGTVELAFWRAGSR